jgi:hypothetical protein
MPVTHPFVSAIGDGGDATLVRPSNWNADHAFPDKNVYLEAPGSVTLATTGNMSQPLRLTLASTDRLTDTGTGRLAISDRAIEPPVMFRRSAGSNTMTTDEFVLDYQRTALYGNARSTLIGTARSVVIDFNPVGRLVLAGRGI